MACSIGRLPTAEPIESKLVNMLWPNDNIVAAPVNRMWQKCHSACQRVNHCPALWMLCVIFYLQLGLAETHWLRWFEEPRRDVLHELASTDALLHKLSQEGNYSSTRCHYTYCLNTDGMIRCGSHDALKQPMWLKSSFYNTSLASVTHGREST